MSTIKAISFDLDDTLVYGSTASSVLADACLEVAEQIPGLSAAALAAANNLVWGSYWPTVQEGWEIGSIDTKTVSNEAWRRALAACGFADEAIVDLITKAHWDHTRRAHRLFDDVASLLELLRPDFRLCILTNGATDTQREKLEAVAITHYFEDIVISGEIGAVKPDSASFRYVLERLDLEAKQVIHIGDSLHTDVAGANAVGMTSVWLNRRARQRSEDDPHPHHEIRSLADLSELLS